MTHVRRWNKLYKKEMNFSHILKRIFQNIRRIYCEVVENVVSSSSTRSSTWPPSSTTALSEREFLS